MLAYSTNHLSSPSAAAREFDIASWNSLAQLKPASLPLASQPATVYTHVRNVVAKLGVDTRTQAVAIATRYSFLEPGEEMAPVLSTRTRNG